MHKERSGRFGSARDAIDAIDSVVPSLECPSCGERVPEHHRFCGFCGASLETTLSKPDSADGTVTANANQLDQEGFKKSRERDWDGAITLYRKALEIDPNHTRARWNLGFALNRIGHYTEAIEVLSKGLSLGIPNYRSNLYYERSVAKANLKQYEEALADIEEALKLQPYSVKCKYFKARIQIYLGNIDAALQGAREVLKNIPDHAGALRILEELGNQ
jgi:tetratricopeptide (TPR) repeat protein